MYSKDIIGGSRTIFSTASVADACDQILGKTVFLPFEIKNRINDRKVIGPTVTIYEDVTDEKLPPQHVLDAVDESASDSVIIVTGNPSLRTVVVQDRLMTAKVAANKHEAAVLNGGVCGLAGIRRDCDFPVYAETVTPSTTLGRFKTISANQPVAIGDITVNPGDLIVGDIDGMMRVPQTVATEALALTRSINNRELEQARLIIQSDSLREGLAKYGRTQPSCAAISQSGRW